MPNRPARKRQPKAKPQNRQPASLATPETPKAPTDAQRRFMASLDDKLRPQLHTFRKVRNAMEERNAPLDEAIKKLTSSQTRAFSEAIAKLQPQIEYWSLRKDLSTTISQADKSAALLDEPTGISGHCRSPHNRQPGRRGRTRTDTPLTGHRLLKPARLPFRHSPAGSVSGPEVPAAGSNGCLAQRALRRRKAPQGPLPRRLCRCERDWSGEGVSGRRLARWARGFSGGVRRASRPAGRPVLRRPSPALPHAGRGPSRRHRGTRCSPGSAAAPPSA
jgi:hypothetical protein